MHICNIHIDKQYYSTPFLLSFYPVTCFIPRDGRLMPTMAKMFPFFYFSAQEINLMDQELDLLDPDRNVQAPMSIPRHSGHHPYPYHYRPPKSPRGAPRPRVSPPSSPDSPRGALRPKREPPSSPVYALSPEYTPTSPYAEPPAQPIANYPHQADYPFQRGGRGTKVLPVSGAQPPVVEDHEAASSDDPEIVYDSKPDRRMTKRKGQHTPY